MEKRYYSENIVRAELKKRLAARSQAEVARDLGIHRQQVSAMATGGPLSARMTGWLGFREVRGLFAPLRNGKRG